MSNRSWFYASSGQQQGPYPEAQLRDLITRGTVGADTLVWTEGMSGWQRAGDIPGLVPGGSAPPSVPQPGGPPQMAGGYSGGPLSIDFEILEFTWRSLVLVIGLIFIIPAPWVLVWYIKWIVPCVHVPGRPNLGFAGEAMAIVPWFFGFVVLTIGIGMIGSEFLSNLMILVQMALYWMFLKWFIANLASNGQPLGLSFSGSVWAYVGWQFLLLSPSSPSSAGPGFTCLDAMVLPEHPGHAARSHLHRQRPGVSVASDRGGYRLHLHHPDTVGVSMDVTVAGVADRFGRARRIGQRLKLNCAGRPRHAGERPAQGETFGLGVESQPELAPCAVQGNRPGHALAPAMAAGPSPGNPAKP